MPLDDFLNPLGENDANRPDLFDIILHSSSDSDDADNDADQDDKYISGPQPVYHLLLQLSAVAGCMSLGSASRGCH